MRTIRCSAASTSLSRKSTRPPILWARIRPRFTQSLSVTSEIRRRRAGSRRGGDRLAAGQIIWCLGGGFGVELPQLVAQRFANHLRELVGGHAAQKDFLGHNDSNLVDDAKKGFPNPSRKRRMALQISANRCQPVPHRRHVVGRFRALAFVCLGWHCRVIGFHPMQNRPSNHLVSSK